MLRKKSVIILMAISLALPLTAGCGGKRLDRQGLDAIRRIAVVSVVVPRIADISRQSNRAVLQASADRALERVRAGLAGVHSWTVLDVVKEKQGKAVQDLGKVSEPGLSAQIRTPEERNRVVAVTAQEAAAWKNAYLGAAGLPVIPHKAMAPDDDGPQPEAAVQQVMQDEAGKLCATLKVDAVAFVHLRASITHPRESAFIVTDGRTDGMLRMAATMVLVDKTGRIIVDRGWPRLDDTARTRDLLPVYRGAGKDFVKEENIDLADPRKKVALAFNALADEAVADLLAELKAAAGK